MAKSFLNVFKSCPLTAVIAIAHHQFSKNPVDKTSSKAFWGRIWRMRKFKNQVFPCVNHRPHSVLLTKIKLETRPKMDTIIEGFWNQKLRPKYPQNDPVFANIGIQKKNDNAKWFQDGSKMAQDSTTWPQDGSKMISKWPQDAPRCPEVVPRWPEYGPNSPRWWSREGPKMTPGLPKMARESPKMDHHEPKMAVAPSKSFRDSLPFEQICRP
jgi:hypothetical protein